MNPYIMGTINEGWDDYVRMVGLVSAPAIQIQETRRAFFAGAYQMLTMMMNTSGQGVSDDEGAEYLEKLRQECIAFYELVKVGLA